METKKREELLTTYDFVGEFSEGLAPARKEDESFHIRQDGTPAYEQRYSFVGIFGGGLAIAMKNNETFFILPDGTRASQRLK